MHSADVEREFGYIVAVEGAAANRITRAAVKRWWREAHCYFHTLLDQHVGEDRRDVGLEVRRLETTVGDIEGRHVSSTGLAARPSVFTANLYEQAEAGFPIRADLVALTLSIDILNAARHVGGGPPHRGAGARRARGDAALTAV